MSDLQLTIPVTLTDEEQRAIAFVAQGRKGLPTRDDAERYLIGAMRIRLGQAVRETRAKGAVRATHFNGAERR